MSIQTETARQHKAGETAEAILQTGGVTTYPVDPLAFIRENCPRLRVAGGHFKAQFDGQLEYHADRKLFLLFYNNKYDEGLPPGTHHPRTRFSVSHELGHYYLDEHRYLLVKGRKAHCSTTEFRSDTQIEREADAFAASFLMPRFLLRPVINSSPLSLARLESTKDAFQTSLVSTTIRSVQLSDFPCAVIGIKDGIVAWSFWSPSLINSGIYPRKRGSSLPPKGNSSWNDFKEGRREWTPDDTHANRWLQIFREDFESVWANEQFIPVPILDTLMVLVTIEESDLMQDENVDCGDDDE